MLIPRQNHRQCSICGFTLIELLIVLAVIGVLVAIVVPVFLSARERARQTVCVSNLGQIGLATAQYVQDYDGTLFPAIAHAGPNGITYWDFLLAPANQIDTSRGPLGPYVRSAGVFYCPSASKELRYPIFNTTASFPTYGLNSVLANIQARTKQPATVGQVQVPSETILAADCAEYADYPKPPRGPWGLIWGRFVNPPSEAPGDMRGRHNGMANILWFDGHVDSRKPVWTPPAYSDPAAPQEQSESLGAILKGPYTGNAKIDDYYYELKKQ